MSPAATPLARIPVGVVVTRHKAASVDRLHLEPVAVLHGVRRRSPGQCYATKARRPRSMPEAPTSSFIARRRLLSRQSRVRHAVALGHHVEHGRRSALSARRRDRRSAEGEGFTETGANLVEQVPMLESIQEIVAAFVAEHHVERPFFKRSATAEYRVAGAARLR